MAAHAAAAAGGGFVLVRGSVAQNAHVVIGAGSRCHIERGGESVVSAVTTLVVSGKTPERIASVGRRGGRLDGRWNGANVALPDVAHTLKSPPGTTTPGSPPCALAIRGQGGWTGLQALAAGQVGPTGGGGPA